MSDAVQIHLVHQRVLSWHPCLVSLFCDFPVIKTVLNGTVGVLGLPQEGKLACWFVDVVGLNHVVLVGIIIVGVVVSSFPFVFYDVS